MYVYERGAVTAGASREASAGIVPVMKRPLLSFTYDALPESRAVQGGCCLMININVKRAVMIGVIVMGALAVKPVSSASIIVPATSTPVVLPALELLSASEGEEGDGDEGGLCVPNPGERERCRRAKQRCADQHTQCQHSCRVGHRDPDSRARCATQCWETFQMCRNLACRC